jgi:TPR repeat protein
MNNSDMCMRAKQYENRGDIEKAYQYYLEAALAEDDGEAMYALAKMYFDGEYVRESYDKAGRYFGLAYDSNAKVSPWTLIIAGSYWERRSGDHKGYFEFAENYYQAAADQGVDYGYECLGQLFFDQGDYKKAYESLSKKEVKNPCGYYYLGKLYDEGLYVDQDVNKAIKLYEKAATFCDGIREGIGEDEHGMRAKQRLRELKTICR